MFKKQHSFLLGSFIRSNLLLSARMNGLLVSKPRILLSFICYALRAISLNPCHTRAAFSRRFHGVLEKCGTPRCAQYDRKHRRSNAVASPLDAVGSHRTPSDGAHFEHAKNKRRRSAIACSVLIRAQWDRHKVAMATQ